MIRYSNITICTLTGHETILPKTSLFRFIVVGDSLNSGLQSCPQHLNRPNVRNPCIALAKKKRRSPIKHFDSKFYILHVTVKLRDIFTDAWLLWKLENIRFRSASLKMFRRTACIPFIQRLSSSQHSNWITIRWIVWKMKWYLEMFMNNGEEILFNYTLLHGRLDKSWLVLNE